MTQRSMWRVERQWVIAFSVALSACGPALSGSGADRTARHDSSSDPAKPPSTVVDPPRAPEPDPAFELGPDYSGPCAKAGAAIEIDAGNSPESFVRAVHCQIFGAEPAESVVKEWSTKLRTVEWVRRIDVAHALCTQAQRSCTFAYGDPWKEQVPLVARCERRGKRELGAVFMYFSHCPGGVNCAMDWANTHAPGMKIATPLLGFGNSPSGHYNPTNPGFWRRALLDARWAGLQFLLLNTFGPELSSPDKPLAALERAISDVGTDVKIALYDDPWAWGKPYFGDAWKTAPDLSDAEAAAHKLYDSKWKPFYSALARDHWYTFRGRPLIYFYNAGTLSPLTRSTPVIARLKELFRSDFGVEPFVVVEDAYFQDPNMFKAADSRFVWDTFRTGHMSVYTMKGAVVDHFMAKWDALGRDKPGTVASERDRIVKGPALLEKLLAESESADLATIATWNDLGEGTGIERNYDYFVAGSWLAPNAFMQLTRAAQCKVQTR